MNLVAKYYGSAFGKRLTKRKVVDFLTPFAFLSPSIVIIGLFVLFPVFFSFYLSFQKWNMFSSQSTFVGLENYSRLIADPEFWQVLKNTLIYTVGTVPLNMVVALFVANELNKRIIGKKFLRTLFFAPVVISPVAAAVIWRWLYDPNVGIINYVFDIFGIGSVNWLNDPDAAMIALIIMGVWKTFGINMVLFSAGLQAIPEHYYEAADIDGAGKFSKFWHITIPLLTPTTLFIMIMSMIASLQVFDIVYVLTSGGPLGSTKVLVFQVYEYAFKFFEMGYASAIAYVLFAILFIFTIIQIKLMKVKY
ncbi:MAG: sugar ABC transporter permease [Melioribacteraceae bacterium]|nr:sugar ABC transporter permease [Melioribacteraceae bacterium]